MNGTYGCLVMAAGLGRRFGGDKLHAVVNGVSMIDHTLAILPKDCFSAIVVVSADDRILENAQSRGMKAVRNPAPEAGISGTIRLGLAQLQDCSHVLFTVADQPMLTEKSLRAALRVASSFPNQIISLSANGQRKNPCVFPAEFYPELMALEGDCGGNAVISRHPSRLRMVEVPAEELTDIDDVETLRAMQNRLQAHKAVLHPLLSIRLFTDQKGFGPGMAQLLSRTRELGSLRSATASMGMAYSKAWNNVKNCEAALGHPLLKRTIGGRTGGGAELTAFAETLLQFYEAYCRELNASADELFLRMLMEYFPEGIENETEE